MNHTALAVTVFSFLVGILVVAIWSNTRVFAQQLPSSVSSATVGNRSSSSSPSNTISSELKAKMCDPSNPSLKVVNTTESRICGIPKTTKPSLLSSAPTTPSTSATISSSSPPPPPPPLPQKTTTTTTATKPTTSATNADPSTPKQQQQIATTNKNNNTNASSRSITNSVAGATIAPVSNPGNKSLSSTSPSSSAIAPHVKAINQQQQPASDNDPMEKKINSTKLNGYDSTKAESSSTKTKSGSFYSISSSHTNDGSSISSSSSLDLASSIKNKIESLIRNNIRGIIDKTPFLLPFP